MIDSSFDIDHDHRHGVSDVSRHGFLCPEPHTPSDTFQIPFSLFRSGFAVYLMALRV